MTDKDKSKISKKPEDEVTPPVDGQISDEELDKVAGGRPQVGGYGTLDYETMTSHGGD